MDRVVVERPAVVVEDGSRESTGSNAIWAIALVLIVGIIAGALYYSGALKRLTAPTSPQKINVEVSAPAAPAAPAAPSSR